MLELSVPFDWPDVKSTTDKILDGALKVIDVTIAGLKGYTTLQTVKKGQESIASLERITQAGGIPIKFEIPTMVWVLGGGLILVLLLKR